MSSEVTRGLVSPPVPELSTMIRRVCTRREDVGYRGDEGLVRSDGAAGRASGHAVGSHKWAAWAETERVQNPRDSPGSLH